MKVVIIGSGSIGLLTTYYLAKLNVNPVIVTKREEQAAIINENGIHIEYPTDGQDSAKVQALSISSIEKLGTIDVAIIAVKSYQVKEVLEEIEDLDVRSTLFLQNGMNHTNLFPQLKIPEVSVAVIEHGAMKIKDNVVRHTGMGQMRWSYIERGSQNVQALFGDWHQPLFPIYYEEQWSKMLLTKLMINACINPLTALLRVKNGELVTNKHTLEMVRTIFDEITEVIPYDQPERLWEQVCQICKITAENRSSMLVDIEKKRRTEVDSILGYVIDEAVKQNKNVEVLTFLYHSIKSLEMRQKG